MVDVSVIIVGAGESARFGENKIFLRLYDSYLIEYSIARFESHPNVREIILVLNRKDINYAGYFLSKYRKVKYVVPGGKERQDSVRNGLLHANCNYVLVHDGARPNVPLKVINDVIDELKESDAVVPAISARDTVAYSRGGMIEEYIDRNRLYSIQTPQGFRKDVLIKAFEGSKRVYTDESAMVYEVLGYRAKIVGGSPENVKVTYTEDMALLNKILENTMEYRIGLGYDSHRLASGRKLVLGGVLITEEFGAVAHSDGDCVIHSIIDALLGAVGEKDIGTFFPDDDPRYAGVSSVTLLREIWERIKDKVKIVNIDCTLRLEQPKIQPFVGDMKSCISSVLELDQARVGIKAKTGEKVGPVGELKLVECETVVLVKYSV
ncbi:MAG TPA: 2-C-methyl-D-erythritol 4-phosphate cytidylyltransferase [Candidatus Hydrothermia bacterium]|nr:2-C-methyl-D-erythritol 4-phosphate cytidylyltransferase [Candidatus Hydrothermae bacterium]MDD3648810.1 2-C-methyl-D-erythritol 4-phosphate cytidylyltransferase [Candidatus Hydrothermia bacterium]MDD5572368.1 2-C-methyl-D-erythritol 4-phosphate cytidylyltransferase [Candidatus Hydrothermia bacterium]HOP31987.1 2-C-methyl-D-erythritol 4-phosphate cytidylyltransferase [Candidatus Hydrothermia bacterium]HRD22411.1 2-C-methyl-D-erythritol 4-phosphate cytidylyltransferase [Candidatus Hydrothermi